MVSEGNRPSSARNSRLILSKVLAMGLLKVLAMGFLKASILKINGMMCMVVRWSSWNGAHSIAQAFMG